MLPLFILLSSSLHVSLQVYTPEILAKVPSVDFCFADATKNDIFYYLFKSIAQTTAIIMHEDYVLSEDDKKLPMKILLHGYTSNVTSPWYKKMKQEYFKKGRHNIVYIDWSIAGNKSFEVSAANVKPVGEYIADFIVKLGVPQEKIHVIGHSLGSHVAGFIGKSVYRKTGKKLGRITGTDPAGPGFERVNYEGRLSKYDASFVDIIHTDVRLFGITKPIGDVDYYANFGVHQPGCPCREIDENCSHARSNEYFIESINTESMASPAIFDENGFNIIPANKTSPEIIFGDATPPTVRGLFYIKTNKTEPYLFPPQPKIEEK